MNARVRRTDDLSRPQRDAGRRLAARLKRYRKRCLIEQILPYILVAAGVGILDGVLAAFWSKVFAIEASTSLQAETLSVLTAQ